MSRALSARLLYCLFDSANMHRWNDHLRTVDLTELDKQAHKAAIAWFLGKYEESERGARMDWTKIIEHSLFSFIMRLVMTDLKPQVFHRIISEKRGEVNRYVLSYFDDSVPDSDPGFRRRLEEYLRSESRSREDDVVSAAHYLATRWEFDTIYDANRSMYGIEQTRAEIRGQIDQHKDLAGVGKILENERTFDFVDLIGQLRFQRRWARTPRVPRTTVLGHSLLVADMIFLNDLDRGADPRQIYNDFYTALFHDLPEVLTKDVISPVKQNVGGLADLLESYERELVEMKIMPLIPESWRADLKSMVHDPFSDYDGERGKRAGRDIKACDLMAAYMEASASIRHGISSRALEDGRRELRERLRQTGGGIGASALIDEFEGIQV
ncbi:MAG: HD domain-containing protein [Candidatus Methanoplasma sp.]|jgi:putative hydrolase of HD superfamily|nr:HD domain-containing protein [Candidatus Methanoplasma sp.]